MPARSALRMRGLTALPPCRFVRPSIAGATAAGVLHNMRRHVHRAQRVDEVFCVLGVDDAKRDCSRPVGPPCDHVQRGTKPLFNLHRQTQSHLRWHAVPLKWTAFDGLGVRAAAELAPEFGDGSDVRQITEARICFWLNRPVSRHLSVGMKQAQAPLATMENVTWVLI